METYLLPAHATDQLSPPGRRATPVFQPFKHHRDPRIAVRSSRTLSSAFPELYAGNIEHLSFEELYRCTYTLVCADHGEALYTQVATTIAAEVGKLAASLDDSAPAPDAEFLRELLGRWKKHNNGVAHINGVFMYMNRTFIEKRHKAPVPELGLRAWRDCMLRRPAGQRLGAALLEMARRERAGEAVDVALVELMSAAIKMLVEVGDGFYEEILEAPFLEDTRRFCAGEVVRLLASPSGCGEYLRTVEHMVDAENARLSRCLDAPTREKVAAVVLTQMVEKNAARLVGMQASGLASMLVDGRYWDLTRMHRLLGRVQDGVPAMRDAMETHFREIRCTVGRNERLLSREKERYRELIDGVFRGEVSFHAALDSCFT